MARSIYAGQLRNRTSRLKLPVKPKPFKLLLAPGIFLAYRRNAGPGTWSVEAGALTRFALADDHEDANGDQRHVVLSGAATRAENGSAR